MPFLAIFLIAEAVLVGHVTSRPFLIVGSVLLLANGLLAMDTIQNRRHRRMRTIRRRCRS